MKTTKEEGSKIFLIYSKIVYLLSEVYDLFFPIYLTVMVFIAINSLTTTNNLMKVFGLVLIISIIIKQADKLLGKMRIKYEIL